MRAVFGFAPLAQADEQDADRQADATAGQEQDRDEPDRVHGIDAAGLSSAATASFRCQHALALLKVEQAEHDGGSIGSGPKAHVIPVKPAIGRVSRSLLFSLPWS